MPKSEVITVRVSPETKRRLEALSQATERPQSWLAEAAIQHYLDDQEWQIRRIQEGIAEAAAGRVIDEERIFAWVSSWGTRDEKPTPQPE